MSTQIFRAGVVLVVRRKDGHVLAFERGDVPGAWQLPQGGIDVGETPVVAAWRELYEETGLDETSVDLSLEIEEWMCYEWTSEIRTAVKRGDECLGQAQRWFVFQPRAESELRPIPDGREFVAWKWMSPQELLTIVAPFRSAVYRRAFSRLAS